MHLSKGSGRQNLFFNSKMLLQTSFILHNLCVLVIQFLYHWGWHRFQICYHMNYELKFSHLYRNRDIILEIFMYANNLEKGFVEHLADPAI
jgi:hypothetical protein